MSEDQPECASLGLNYRSPVQEQHIDFLLEEEFASNPDFLLYFVKAAAESVGRYQAGSSVSKISQPIKTSKCRAVRSVVTGAGESDVVAIYCGSDPKPCRVAILLENKIKAQFQKKQAERYGERGEAGVRNNDWDRFWTCLVAPEKYASGSAGFDARVSLEQLSSFFNGRAGDQRSTFKAGVFEQAISRYSASGVQHPDEVMSAFRAYYAGLAEHYFLGSEIGWERPREAWHGDSWFIFRNNSFPKGSVITHKTGMGAVHLSFPNTSVLTLRSVCERVTKQPFGFKQTGKSASIEFIVGKIKDFAKPAKSEDVIASAFLGVSQLYKYWTENSVAIEEALKIGLS